MPESKFENRSQMIETTLGLLNALEDEENQSQRSLATRLGVALGLTNSLLKRCVKKGLLKVSQAPARRFAYYLTPEGFKEKSHLTAEYLSGSLSFFRRARGEYLEALAYCRERGWTRVALCGASELAEISGYAANEAGVELVGVIDPARNTSEFCGLRVIRNIEDAGPLDAVIVTDASDPQAAFSYLCEGLPPERVLTPSFLHVARNGDTGGNGGGA